MFRGDKLRIFLDNNFWDYLADNNVDLLHYFPKNLYELFITTHGKYEIIQLCRNDKQYVKEYALNTLGAIVKEDAVFGFHSDLFPVEYQRASGFGSGRFAEKRENTIRAEIFAKYGLHEKRKETQILFKQEADIELAVRSIDHPVITFDTHKKGPLLYALENGWKVIPLDSNRCNIIPSDDYMNEIVAAIESKRT